MQEYVKKIALIGDWGTGKTSLVRRFVKNAFDDEYIQTVGTKVSKKVMKLIYENEEILINLMLWDILGQKGYRAIKKNAFTGVDGAILVCDITRRDTLDNLKSDWHPFLTSVTGKIPMVILGNKCDLLGIAAFQLTDIQETARTLDILPELCYLSSAKTGENVERTFIELSKRVISDTKSETEVDAEPIELEEFFLEESYDSLKSALDGIITDFVKSYDNEAAAMEIMRTCFKYAGLSLKYPTREGIELFIDNLKSAEKRKGLSTDEIEKNKKRRLRILEQVKSENE